jgi:D-aminopeptidase
MAIDFVQSEMADKAAFLPGATRAGRRIEYSAPDMITLYNAFRSAVALARG